MAKTQVAEKAEKLAPGLVLKIGAALFEVDASGKLAPCEGDVSAMTRVAVKAYQR